jgi:hypothetical protein
MSKAKLLEAGGRYVGTKMKDVLKKIRHRKSAAKSKKNIEKIGLGTKSVKRYQNVASSGSGDKSAIVPVKAQTRKGSSFKTHKMGTKGRTGYFPSRYGSPASAESWRADMEKLTNMPSFNELSRSIFRKKRKAQGGMLKLKRGGDNMPARNKKNFRPTEKGAGMTKAGVAAYRRANPGSKLKTAVTGKVKPGSKAAKRRKSFCARSAGQMKKFPKAAADPNSRLRQARRRWKC